MTPSQLRESASRILGYDKRDLPRHSAEIIATVAGLVQALDGADASHTDAWNAGVAAGRVESRQRIGSKSRYTHTTDGER